MAVKRSVQVGPNLFDDFEAALEPESGFESSPGSSLDAASKETAWANPPAFLIVRADGGSRGNPGPAAYGALVTDEDDVVLNREGLTLGIATNNVAEYSGLIAGLEMAHAINPAAVVEVKMDSKLVIEQMAGRWKVKHPDMKPLAQKATALRPAKITWSWVPRAENKAADALVNSALDGVPVPRL